MEFKIRSTVVVTMIAFATSLTVVAQEKQIRRQQLPPAVETTVARESQGATINGFASETENGKRLYEVELSVDGHSKDITMDGDGNILEIEEQVTMNSLPATVQEGLRAAAGKGSIARIEALTKSGKLVAYEALVKSRSKHYEIQVGPNGEKLARRE